MNKEPLSADKYLLKHDLNVYFKDAVTQMLQYKSDNIKLNPASFLHKYFSSIKQGTHRVFREYSFISATARNRKSFISNFWNTFQHFSIQGDLLSIRDYHSLLCLLCHDFEFKIPQRVVRTILTDDASDCLITFSDFLYAFQLHFFYDEFCLKCLEMFTNIQEHSSTNVGTDLVNTSDVQRSDGISSNHFLHCIERECYDKDIGIAAPPQEVVQMVLSSSVKITFYGFMMLLSKNEMLNKSVNVLPEVRPSSGMHRH